MLVCLVIYCLLVNPLRIYVYRFGVWSWAGLISFGLPWTPGCVRGGLRNDQACFVLFRESSGSFLRWAMGCNQIGNHLPFFMRNTQRILLEVKESEAKRLSRPQVAFTALVHAERPRRLRITSLRQHQQAPFVLPCHKSMLVPHRLHETSAVLPCVPIIWRRPASWLLSRVASCLRFSVSYFCLAMISCSIDRNINSASLPRPRQPRLHQCCRPLQKKLCLCSGLGLGLQSLRGTFGQQNLTIQGSSIGVHPSAASR